MQTLTPGKRFLHSSEVGAWHVPTGLSVGQRIGLLGGSFNPAHEGHLEISLLAISLLELDEVWWLVTPQNPLKIHTYVENVENQKNLEKQMKNQ